jgi:hypothetical protein
MLAWFKNQQVNLPLNETKFNEAYLQANQLFLN